jgi:hypothetical protein
MDESCSSIRKTRLDEELRRVRSPEWVLLSVFDDYIQTQEKPFPVGVAILICYLVGTVMASLPDDFRPDRLVLDNLFVSTDLKQVHVSDSEVFLSTNACH